MSKTLVIGKRKMEKVPLIKTDFEARTYAIIASGESGLPFWYHLKEGYEKTIKRLTQS